jgi:spore maturation protein CgeB
MKIVIFGLSITSSWGNGHANTYRALVRELFRRGHHVHFLERDVPWYASHRDFLSADSAKIDLYASIADLKSRFGREIAKSDAVIVGSYVPEGVALGHWVTSIADGVTAFYDIDTPITMEALRDSTCEYLSADLIGAYDVYLSFTGGPLLERLERVYGARRTAPLYCSVDPEFYFPQKVPRRWQIGYLGTYAADRQPALDALLTELADQEEMRFVVAGPQYPETVKWPKNVDRIEHLAPSQHSLFYAQQRFTLNLTRSAMAKVGFSPSVRLFEAAACAVPIISDVWPGLESFFVPKREILLADRPGEVLEFLRGLSEEESSEIGRQARSRVLCDHTSAHRARELEEVLQQAAAAKAGCDAALAMSI